MEVKLTLRCLRLSIGVFLLTIALIPVPSIRTVEKPLIIGNNIGHIRVEYGLLWTYAHHSFAFFLSCDSITPIVDNSLGIGRIKCDKSGVVKSGLLVFIGCMLMRSSRRIRKVGSVV